MRSARDVPTPSVAGPVHRLGDTERIEHLLGRPGALLEVIPAVRVAALTVPRACDQNQPAIPCQLSSHTLPALLVGEQAVPQNDRRTAPGGRDLEPANCRIDELP